VWINPTGWDVAVNRLLASVDEGKPFRTGGKLGPNDRGRSSGAIDDGEGSAEQASIIEPNASFHPQQLSREAYISSSRALIRVRGRPDGDRIADLRRRAARPIEQPHEHYFIRSKSDEPAIGDHWLLNSTGSPQAASQRPRRLQPLLGFAAADTSVSLRVRCSARARCTVLCFSAVRIRLVRKVGDPARAVGRSRQQLDHRDGMSSLPTDCGLLPASSPGP
jgi:hypothetical protein